MWHCKHGESALLLLHVHDLYNMILKNTRNLKSHNRVYILSSKQAYRLMSAHVVVQFINMLRFDRAGLSEIVDCRRCSTLFDFSEVTEDVSFAELVEFPRVAFFGSVHRYSIFSNNADFRSSPKIIILYLSN